MIEIATNITPLLRIVHESAIGHAYKVINFIMVGPMAGTVHVKAVDQNKTTVRLRKTTQWEIIEGGEFLTVSTEEMQELFKAWQQLRIKAKRPAFDEKDVMALILQKVAGGKGKTYGF